MKNLKRWIQNGPRRKKGGRKTHDPQMEAKLREWVDNFRAIYKELPSRRHIKETAIKFSQFPGKFKASKGWYEKFMLRHFKPRPAGLLGSAQFPGDAGGKEKLGPRESEAVTVGTVHIHQKIARLWKFFSASQSRSKIGVEVDSFINAVVSTEGDSSQRADPEPRRALRRALPSSTDCFLETDLRRGSLEADRSPLRECSGQDLHANTCNKQRFLPLVESVRSRNFGGRSASPQLELRLGQSASGPSKDLPSGPPQTLGHGNLFDSDKFNARTDSSRPLQPNSFSGDSRSFKAASDPRRDSGPPRLRLEDSCAPAPPSLTQKTRKVKTFPPRAVRRLSKAVALNSGLERQILRNRGLQKNRSGK